MKPALLMAAALAAATLHAPALGEARPLTAEAGKGWKHAETGVVFPSNVGDFERVSGVDFGESQSDVSFSYRDDKSGTIGTLYMYRAGLPDVSLWAERSDAAMRKRSDAYGTFDAASRLWSTYTPTSGGTNSGIRVVYPVSGKDFTATGLAVQQRGPWLFKLRMSSETLSAAQLDAAISRFLQSLALGPLPGEKPRAAYAIRPCADRLPSGSPTHLSALPAASIRAQLPVALAATAKLNAAPFCRDASSTDKYAVYRPGSSKTSYVLAYGDSGGVVQVAPWPGAASQYAVMRINADALLGYGRFDALPPPATAFDWASGSTLEYGQWRTPAGAGKIEVIGEAE